MCIRDSPRENLRYIHVLHVGFDNQVHEGELVVNKDIADDVLLSLIHIFIVIDNADCMINDDVRRFINFELSNQYMLFLRNCDGLNVSDKSFKVLKFDNNRITLEEEL